MSGEAPFTPPGADTFRAKEGGDKKDSLDSTREGLSQYVESYEARVAALDRMNDFLDQKGIISRSEAQKLPRFFLLPNLAFPYRISLYAKKCVDRDPSVSDEDLRTFASLAEEVEAALKS